MGNSANQTTSLRRNSINVKDSEDEITETLKNDYLIIGED